MRRRAERVADRIRDVLAGVIRGELRDPRIGFVTVTDVRLSPDLQYARVFVSFLDSTAPGARRQAPESQAVKEALRALAHATPFLRRRLAREAGLRRTPELRFEIDDTVVDGLRIEALLEEVTPPAAEEAAAEAPAADDAAPPERHGDTE